MMFCILHAQNSLSSVAKHVWGPIEDLDLQQTL